MNAQKKYSVPAVNRALSIIEVLSENPKGLTLNQLGEKLGLEISNIYRICMTLQNRDYLIKDDATKQFILSRKILSLAYSAMNVDSIIDISINVMKELRDVLGETVFLCSLIENECVILEQILAKHPFKFSVEIGSKNNYHTSSASKALLAWLPEEELSKLITSIKYTRFNDRTITSSGQFKKELEKTKERGYAIDDAEEIEGVHCVSAPILDYKNNPVASITITGPSHRLPKADFNEIGSIVKKHADRISKALGSK